MVAVNYPSYPGGVDVGQIIGLTERGYDRSVDQKNEAEAKKLLGQYANTLYGGQQDPQQGLGALNSLFQQQAAPAGQVQRSPLPPVQDYASQRVAQAFGDPGSPQVAGQAPLSSNAIAGRFLKTVRDGGVSNPYALAAIAATGKRESGFDPKNATRVWSDPSQSGEAGMAGGIMSWRGPRLQAMQAFAQQNGDDPNAPTPETQAKFLLNEDPSLIQQLNQAQSPEEAQQIMNNAWKFAGYNQQGGETAARMQLAQQYAPQFGGQAQAPSQQALEGLAVGGSVPVGQPQGVQGADASGAMPQQADPSSLLPPREIMAGLLSNPNTRQFGIGLAKAAIGLRQDANDPQKRLEYQIALEKLHQLQNPQADAPKFGNSVVWGQDENNNWVALQPSSSGGLVPADTGGIKLSPPGASNLNLGTQYGVRDRNGNVINTVPIDNAGKASDTAEGKGRGEARLALPGDIQNASQTAQQIDELLSNPGLDSIVGPADQYRGSWTLSDSGRDALARYNQLKGRAFLQAYGILRGGGQITEVEGQKAQDAMARMDRAQGEKEFRQALTDFRDAVQQGVLKLQEVAGQGGQAAPSGNRTSSGVQWSIDE